MRRLAPVLLVAFPLLGGCEDLLGLVPDVKLGPDQGLPPLSGSTTVDLPDDFVCGGTIADPRGTYTITSSGTPTDCTLVFSQDILALAAADYGSHPELEGAKLVNAVEVAVNDLTIEDASSGVAIVAKKLDAQVFGTTVLTEQDLTGRFPVTKVIKGAPLDALKEIVANRQDLVIPVDVKLVVDTSNMPPALSLTFDAEPTLVFGF